MKNDNLVGLLVQLLKKADKLASSNSARQFGLPEHTAPNSQFPVVQVMPNKTSAMRTVLFGLALMLLSIFMIQLGNALKFNAFSWGFYVASVLYLLIGVIQFDRGLKCLDFERLE